MSRLVGRPNLGALVFNDDGTVGAIYTDTVAGYLRDLSPSGHVEVLRASDVEPEDGGWAARIRSWVPGGEVTLPVTEHRTAALAAEVRYLEEVL